MSDRPPRLVRFVSAELEQLPNDRCRARVELLHRDGATHAAEVEGKCDQTSSLRSVAQAAAEAVRRAVAGKGDSLEVDDVAMNQSFGKRTVFISVSALYQGQRRGLLGFCLVDPDPVRAAALALLNAVNRFLNIG